MSDVKSEALDAEHDVLSHSAAPAEPASVELREIADAVVEVAASAPKRKRAPTATPRKKKVVPEETSPVVEPATPRHSVSIEDPLFFAGLNVVHRKMQQDARRTKLSSSPIV